MSVYDMRTIEETDPAQRPRTSGLAIGSFLCAIFICCPIATVIAPVLGIVALIGIGRQGGAQRGRGFAIAGILIGAAVTVLWVIVAVWMFSLAARITTLPQTMLIAGQSGDLSAFRNEFDGAATRAGDDEVRSFFDELTARYGRIQSVDPVPGQSAAATPDGRLLQRYTLRGEKGIVDVEVDWLIVDEASGRVLVMRPVALQVIDPDRPPLRFPAGTAPDHPEDASHGDHEEMDEDL